MYMLRNFLSFQIFHKTNASSNVFAAEALYKNYNIPRQCALDGSFLRGTTIARDKLIFLLQNLGVLMNTQKLIWDLALTVEFLGVLVDSQNITLSLPQ